jgi:hypothetical protein
MIRKHLLLQCALGLAMLLAAAAACAQQGDRFVIPLSAPGQPVEVHVSLVYGSISVEAHGNAGEVVLEARPEDEDGDRGEESGGRRQGMRRLPNRSLGLAVEEQNNVVKVSMDGAPRSAVIRLLVPRKASLKLSTVNDGDIAVRGIDGDLELQNTNGDVSALDVSGAVVAHTVNGEVKVTLGRVDPKAAMAFSTLNGDVDVTVPADTRASLRMRSDNGEIYSDFDVQLGPPEAKVTQGRSGGRYRLEVEREVRGTVNGGGPEIQLRTFNGDIYLRRRG